MAVVLALLGTVAVAVWQWPRPEGSSVPSSGAIGSPPRDPTTLDAPASDAQRTLVSTSSPTRILIAKLSELRGRVVDPVGQPQAGLEVEVEDAREGGPRTTWYAKTDADGRFLQPVNTLQVTITAPYRPLLQGSALAVDLNAHDLREEVQVVVIAAADWPSLAGTVVDEAGHAVPDVYLHCEDSWFGDRPMSSSTTTDAQGGFELPRPAGATASQVELLSEPDRFEPLPRGQWFAWGRRDVRLVLQQRLPLSVRVIDDRGLAVDGVRVSLRCSDPYEQRELDAAAGGFSGTIRRGRSWLSVQADKGFDSRRGAVPVLEPIDVGDVAPVECTIRLLPVSERVVRVLGPGDVPTVGSHLQLLDGRGARVALTSEVETDPAPGLDDTATLLASVVTDEAGEARLRGPATRALALRALGPGHVPTVVEPVDLAPRQALVVHVAKGASATVRLSPSAVVAEWRARLPDVVVRLSRTLEDAIETWPVDTLPGLALGDDGAFTIDGAPPGDWQLSLGAAQRVGPMGPPLLTLTDGDHGVIDLDVADWAMGTVVGRALVNGTPRRNEKIALLDTSLRYPAPVRDSLRVLTDADGRFRARVRSGRYGVKGPSISIALPLGEVEVLAGQTVEHTFDWRSGKLELTLVDETGQPARGVNPCLVREPADLLWTPLGPTDGDGCKRAEVEAGTWHVTVMIPSRQRAAVPGPRQRLFERLRAARVPVGDVDIHAGETARATLRVPAAALR